MTVPAVAKRFTVSREARTDGRDLSVRRTAVDGLSVAVSHLRGAVHGAVRWTFAFAAEATASKTASVE